MTTHNPAEHFEHADDPRPSFTAHGTKGDQHLSEHARSGEESSFAGLMADVMSGAERFGHREHIHLTWLAVRRYGTSKAVDLVSRGIQRTARYAGAPQKYNATISRAWVELVGYHAAQSPAAGFDAFVENNPALLEKRLLRRFYRSTTLASPQARTGWIDPDLAPFPWITETEATETEATETEAKPST